MRSKTAPLSFPKKGEARPPADATGRTAEAGEPVATAAAIAPPPAAAAPASVPASSSSAQLAGALAGAMEQGGDDLVQINVTVPRRIRTQLHMLKLTGQAHSIKAVTTEAVTKAVEQLLASAKGGA